MGVIGVSNAAFCGPGNVVFYEVVHLVLLLLLLGGTGEFSVNGSGCHGSRKSVRELKER